MKIYLKEFVLAQVTLIFMLAVPDLAPTAQAVVPPPDGAYPNFTTAEGQNALQSLTTGAANTALGAYSLFSTTTASFNTAVGLGRWTSTPEIQIRLLVLQHFYSTPAPKTPPLELTHLG